MVTKCPQLEVYVIVNFLSQVVFFLFLLFLGMVINETEKKKNFNTWDKKLTTTYILHSPLYTNRSDCCQGPGRLGLSG